MPPRMSWTNICDSIMKRDPLSKKYYRIKEVSELLELPQSTLRFWESQFSMIKPYRDAKGNRYYTPRDIEIIKMVRYLVKERGLKIEAALAELRNNREGIERRSEVIDRLKSIRDRLNEMIESLNVRK